MDDNPKRRYTEKTKFLPVLLESIKDMDAFIASSQFVARQLGVISWSLGMRPQFESIRLLYGNVKSVDSNTRQSLLVRVGLTKKLIESFFPNGIRVFREKIKKSLMMRILSQANKFPKLRHVATLHTNAEWVKSVVFNQSGTLLASSCDTTTTLWRISPDCSTSMVCLLNGHTAIVRSVAFHPSKSFLATGYEDGTIKIWNCINASFLVTMSTCESQYGSRYSVNSISFDPTGLILASGSNNGITRLWKLSKNISSATCVATLPDNSWTINSVAFHPTAPFLTTCSEDKTVKLWRFSPDGSTTTCVATLEEHSDTVWSVAFHPTAPLLATCSEDKTAKLWRFSSDGSTATCVATLEGHCESVQSVAFDSSGTLLATCSKDDTTKLWRISPDGLVATCIHTLLKGTRYGVPFFAFHPKLPLSATGSQESPSVVALMN